MVDSAKIYSRRKVVLLNPLISGTVAIGTEKSPFS